MNTRKTSIRPRLARIGLALVLALGLTMILVQIFVSPVSADGPDSRGTDFWLAFPGNYSYQELTLFITGEVTTTGVVSIPSQSWTSPFTVTPGAVITVILPDVQLTNSDTVEDKGVHVMADDEVTVYGLNRVLYTTDAYLGLPTDVLGTEYIVLSYDARAGGGTQFAVVGTEISTTVTITPSVTTSGHTAGTPYTVTLNQGQTYLLQNATGGTDLSGSIVTADKPIAVFGSNKCTNIPPGYGACDHTVEQLPPVSTWGQNFATFPLATRSGDTFRILASTDGTTITVNSSVVATLDRGEFHETILTNTVMITATAPVLVAQYSHGTVYDGAVADPFMMLTPPYEQFLGEYTVSTPASGFTGNYVNIVAPDAVVGHITVDGTTVPSNAYTAIGSSSFSGVAYTVTLGSHHLEGPLPFGVFSYGFGNYDSYGYPGGSSYVPLSTIDSVTLTLDRPVTLVGQGLCMTTLVADQYGAPLEGVRVDFSVSGANTASGFDHTDADGEATFCYTGSNAGDDTIVATAASKSDTQYASFRFPIYLPLVARNY